MLNTYPYNMIPSFFITELPITEDMPYEIEEIPARELILPQRIDLIAKWIYIEAYDKRLDMTYAKELYAKHIEAFSEGTFTEPGNDEKNTLEKYFTEFDQLIEDIKVKGFQEEKSLILVGKGNVLIDGSHRCACAAYFNKTVKVIRFNQLNKNYDAEFFLKRGLDKEYIDQLVLKYTELKDNLYLACLWPVASNQTKRQEAISFVEKIGQTVYVRDLGLRYQGMKNLMQQIYGHQNWVGDYTNHHAGVDEKAKNCYAWHKKGTFILFHCDSLDAVIDVKAKIRDLFGLENHAIHISDDTLETRQMAQLLYNVNSRMHLNYAEPDAFITMNKMLEDFKQVLAQKRADISRYLADTSSILAIYGLREAGDIDYLTDSEITELGREDMENHPSLYPIDVTSLLSNPDFYFVYQGVKFVEPYMLLRMKQIRGSEKDPKDCKMLQKLMRKSAWGRYYESGLTKQRKSRIDRLWEKKN